MILACDQEFVELGYVNLQLPELGLPSSRKAQSVCFVFRPFVDEQSKRRLEVALDRVGRDEWQL